MRLAGHGVRRPARAPSHRILVVDDTPHNIRLLEAILVPRGYAVVSAHAPAQPRSTRSRASSPDIVLLDIMMPGMDGHEVCRRLRADPATALLPVVMVTASGDQQKVEGARIGRRRLHRQAGEPG